MGLGFLRPWEERIYAAARIIVGLLFMQHGLQKIFGLFGGVPADTPAAIQWSAGLIELVGGALVAVGLFAAPAAFVASGMMAVAYFMAHQPRALFPIVNGGEPAILYCWFFLLVAARGAGIWSVDASRAGSTAPTRS